jgi:tetratricopeptide (TPR) repeat protein
MDKSSTKYKLECAKILLTKKDYNKVIKIADEILSTEKTNYTAWILRGNAYYFKNNIFDSEESFVKAIRTKPDKSNKFDVKMLFRLGMTYIRRETWGDAKTVFFQILKDNPSYSFAWRYLGYSLMKLGEHDSAEEALNEANLLDIENPVVWAYLCMFSIQVGRRYQALECLNELVRNKFNDVKILEEIGLMFYSKKEYELSVDIFEKLIEIEPNNTLHYISLAEVYTKIESKKHLAFELIKNRRNFVDDPKEKLKIDKFIEQISSQLGLIQSDEDFPSHYEKSNDAEDEDELDKNMGSDFNLNLSANKF